MCPINRQIGMLIENGATGAGNFDFVMKMLALAKKMWTGKKFGKQINSLRKRYSTDSPER